MLFPTLEFAIFFAIVLPVYWALRRSASGWKVFVLLASWVFYGWWDWRFVGLIVVCTLVNQMLALAIAGASRRRLWLLLAVVVDLGILGFFKYYDFFAMSVEKVVRSAGLPVHVRLLEIILPVGISFYTFQALSYVIDVYRRKIQPSSLLDFAVYLAFFPQLVAGPIVRASEFLPQIAARVRPSGIDTARAFRLIGVGLFKKVVIADLLATQLVDSVFARPEIHAGPEIALAIYGYAAQIYCDFSAYSDIAIGVALLMGFRFPDNFNAPYTAHSVQDFWRRWHMTLSRWLRDYLYISLGGSRRGALRTLVNLMITMLLGGLWHGASWRFVLWGALHGAALAGERVWLQARGGRPLLPKVLRQLWVFHFVCFCWVFFRAPSMGDAWTMLTRLGEGWSARPEYASAVMVALVIGLVGQATPRRWISSGEDLFSRMPLVFQGVILSVGLLVIDALGAPGVAAFIYFQF